MTVLRAVLGRTMGCCITTALTKVGASDDGLGNMDSPRVEGGWRDLWNIRITVFLPGTLVARLGETCPDMDASISASSITVSMAAMTAGGPAW